MWKQCLFGPAGVALDPVNRWIPVFADDETLVERIFGSHTEDELLEGMFPENTWTYNQVAAAQNGIDRGPVTWHKNRIGSGFSSAEEYLFEATRRIPLGALPGDSVSAEWETELVNHWALLTERGAVSWREYNQVGDPSTGDGYYRFILPSGSQATTWEEIKESIRAEVAANDRLGYPCKEIERLGRNDRCVFEFGSSQWVSWKINSVGIFSDRYRLDFDLRAPIKKSDGKKEMPAGIVEFIFSKDLLPYRPFASTWQYNSTNASASEAVSGHYEFRDSAGNYIRGPSFRDIVRNATELRLARRDAGNNKTSILNKIGNRSDIEVTLHVRNQTWATWRIAGGAVGISDDTIWSLRNLQLITYENQYINLSSSEDVYFRFSEYAPAEPDSVTLAIDRIGNINREVFEGSTVINVRWIARFGGEARGDIVLSQTRGLGRNVPIVEFDGEARVPSGYVVHPATIDNASRTVSGVIVLKANIRDDVRIRLYVTGKVGDSDFVTDNEVFTYRNRTDNDKFTLDVVGITAITIPSGRTYLPQFSLTANKSGTSRPVSAYLWQRLNRHGDWVDNIGAASFLRPNRMTLLYSVAVANSIIRNLGGNLTFRCIARTDGLPITGKETVSPLNNHIAIDTHTIVFTAASGRVGGQAEPSGQQSEPDLVMMVGEFERFVLDDDETESTISQATGDALEFSDPGVSSVNILATKAGSGTIAIRVGSNVVQTLTYRVDAATDDSQFKISFDNPPTTGTSGQEPVLIKVKHEGTLVEETPTVIRTNKGTLAINREDVSPTQFVEAAAAFLRLPQVSASTTLELSAESQTVGQSRTITHTMAVEPNTALLTNTIGTIANNDILREGKTTTFALTDNVGGSNTGDITRTFTVSGNATLHDSAAGTGTATTITTTNSSTTNTGVWIKAAANVDGDQVETLTETTERGGTTITTTRQYTIKDITLTTQLNGVPSSIAIGSAASLLTATPGGSAEGTSTHVFTTTVGVLSASPTLAGTLKTLTGSQAYLHHTQTGTGSVTVNTTREGKTANDTENYECVAVSSSIALPLVADMREDADDFNVTAVLTTNAPAGTDSYVWTLTGGSMFGSSATATTTTPTCPDISQPDVETDTVQTIAVVWTRGTHTATANTTWTTLVVVPSDLSTEIITPTNIYEQRVYRLDSRETGQSAQGGGAEGSDWDISAGSTYLSSSATTAGTSRESAENRPYMHTESVTANTDRTLNLIKTVGIYSASASKTITILPLKIPLVPVLSGRSLQCGIWQNNYGNVIIGDLNATFAGAQVSWGYSEDTALPTVLHAIWRRTSHTGPVEQQTSIAYEFPRTYMSGDDRNWSRILLGTSDLPEGVYYLELYFESAKGNSPSLQVELDMRKYPATNPADYRPTNVSVDSTSKSGKAIISWTKPVVATAGDALLTGTRALAGYKVRAGIGTNVETVDMAGPDAVSFEADLPSRQRWARVTALYRTHSLLPADLSTLGNNFDVLFAHSRTALPNRAGAVREYDSDGVSY